MSTNAQLRGSGFERVKHHIVARIAWLTAAEDSAGTASTRYLCADGD